MGLNANSITMRPSIIPLQDKKCDHLHRREMAIDINITEEINCSGIWTSLVGNETVHLKHSTTKSSKKKSHGSKKRSGMSVLKEDDDEEENGGGITIKIEKSKSGKEPGSCEEHASLVKHSDTNGTNV